MAALRTLEALLNGRAEARGRTERTSPAPVFRTDDWEELRREIARCRRFARPFALIGISSASADPAAFELRSIDRAWSVGDRTYLLLPETDRAAAEALISRLQRNPAPLTAEASVAIASFPDDGLTSGALLKALRRPIESVGRERPSPRIADSPVHA